MIVHLHRLHYILSRVGVQTDRGKITQHAIGASVTLRCGLGFDVYSRFYQHPATLDIPLEFGHAVSLPVVFAGLSNFTVCYWDSILFMHALGPF